MAKKNEHQLKYCALICTIRNKCLKRNFFNKIKALKSQAKAPEKVPEKTSEKASTSQKSTTAKKI